MDKSPSINCLDVDDGSWDLDENIEESLQELDNLSSNSWDSPSGKEGKAEEETAVEAFRDDESLNSWRSSKVIKALEISVAKSDSSDSLNEICLPEEEHGKCQFDVVQKFESSPKTVNDNADMKIKLFNNVEQCLIVEDLEEPEGRIDNQVKLHCLQDIQEDGDEEESDDDKSDWKIPISCRTYSSTNSSVLHLPILRYKSKSEQNVRIVNAVKKSKSYGDLTARENFSIRDALMQYEGNNLKEMEEKQKVMLHEVMELGDKSMHFQEIECRTLRTNITNVKKESPDVSESDESKEEDNHRVSETVRTVRVGSPCKVSEEAVSLPNIAEAGRSELRSGHEFRKAVSYTTNQMLDSKLERNSLTESWIFLDERGQTQPVTMDEVNILLNGRSADAVLQENKAHFIPKIVRNANSDLILDRWNFLVEESLQHFLHQEDMGGEDDTRKTIGLERKLGNMLLYIQSGVDLTSSVKFIPVDTEMIHMWRQSKENVSPISSEADARIQLPTEEMTIQHITENDNPETLDDIRGHTNDRITASTSVRRRRNRQNKVDDCDRQFFDNQKIIESLTDDIKQLKMRLETERSRSSSLEQENFRLRGQLDKCRSGQSSSESQKTKSEFTDSKKKSYSQYIPEVSSSSIISVDEFRNDNDNDRSSLQDTIKSSIDQKNFKEALDKNLNDIQEILKCKDSSPVRTPRYEDRRKIQIKGDVTRASSTASLTTFPVTETTSQALSLTTGSVDSWCKASKLDLSPKRVTDIMYDLEKENAALIEENKNLRKKLNEISTLLNDYVSSNAVTCQVDDIKQIDPLRNQMLSLTSELENIKSAARNSEYCFKIKDAMIRKELEEKSVTLEQWKTSILNIFKDLDESRKKFDDWIFPPGTQEFSSDLGKFAPNDLLIHLKSLITQMTKKIIDFQKENSILKKSMQKSIFFKNSEGIFDRPYDVNFVQEMTGLLCNKTKEESHEKNMLEDRIKRLTKTNDKLFECQLDHSQRLNSTTLLLQEERAKVENLEQTLNLLEMEKIDLKKSFEMSEKQRSIIQEELEAERSKIVALKIDCEQRKAELREMEEKVKDALEKTKTLEKLKSNCEELESRETYQNQKLQSLIQKSKNIEKEKNKLEEELNIAKQEAEESAKKMNECMSQLKMKNASFLKMTEKYNDATKTLASLKKSCEDYEKQSANNSKMVSKIREELENSKSVIKDLEERNKKLEEGKKKALGDLKKATKSEKEKAESLEKLIKEKLVIDEELADMNAKLESQAKARDKLLKEQKDLANQVDILKKKNSEFEEKYRNVKAECNERARLLKKLDVKLKENFLEYNNRIAFMEKNVRNIIDKALLYRDSCMERNSEVNSVIQELQDQLQSASMEKNCLEKDFYFALMQLQREVNERKMLKCFSVIDSKNSKESEYSLNNDEMENRLKRAEIAVAEGHERIKELEKSKEEEREKYEKIIAELNSEINKYQVRLEVMLKNISSYCNTSHGSASETKIQTLEQKVLELTEELEKKTNQLAELTAIVENNEAQMKLKVDECQTFRQKVLHLKEKIKNMKNQFSNLQEFLSTVNKNVETYQKDRDEVAEKLAKSLKVIFEERESKQSAEAVYATKEKHFKEQIDVLQKKLMEKKQDYAVLLQAMEDKTVLVNKWQEDVKKWKSEVGALKEQIATLRKGAVNGDDGVEKQRELKAVRESNLELRKTEGELQKRIINLEDNLRNANLLIKELEGDLTTEKNSRKLLKDMIRAAKNDIESYRKRGELTTSIAEKIERRFNLPHAQSRELLSGYRAVS